MSLLTTHLKLKVSIVESKPMKPAPPKQDKNDITKDYEYTRANLYSLIEKGQEAINGIMELAGKVQVLEHMKLQVNLSRALQIPLIS